MTASSAEPYDVAGSGLTLAEFINLEEIEVDLFRRPSNGAAYPVRVFGGQVAAQALYAAGLTVPSDLSVHSMHAYFLRPGNPMAPIVYAVERVRDGRSFVTRRVAAIQGGEQIFHLSASFHRDEEGLFDYQTVEPTVAGPESFPDVPEWHRRASPGQGDEWAEWLATQTVAADIRFVDAPHSFRHPDDVRPPRQQVWIRTRETLAPDRLLHCCALTYFGDVETVPVAGLPTTYAFEELAASSLDYAVWFHRPFRADRWLLHEREVPVSAGALALVRTQIFDEHGQLVASTAMEGLLRKRRTDRP